MKIRRKSDSLDSSLNPKEGYKISKSVSRVSSYFTYTDDGIFLVRLFKGYKSTPQG